MKFKKVVGEDYKSISLTDKDGDVLFVETIAGGKPGLYVETDTGDTGSTGVYVTRKKALKLAHAIIAELDPENMWVMS